MTRSPHRVAGLGMVLVLALGPWLYVGDADAGGRPSADPLDPVRLVGGEVFVYRFDGGDWDAAGNVLDRSPNAGSGVPRAGNCGAGPPAPVAGPPDHDLALRFPAGTNCGGGVTSGSELHLQNPGVLDSLDADFTLMAWFRAENSQSGATFLASQVDGGTKLRWWRSGGTPCIDIRGPGSSTTLCDSAPVPENRWVHLAVVQRGVFVTFYVDGLVTSNQTHPPGLYAGSSVGSATVMSAWSSWRGALDEFRLYDHALGPAEIVSLKDFSYFHPNEPPVARIAPVPDAECLAGRATLTLDGTSSSDPDPGDLANLTYAWTAPVALDTPAAPTATGSFPLGNSTVGLTVDDRQYSSSASATVRVVDTVPPTTGASLAGTAGSNGWWRSAVDVTLLPTDACGVAETRHRVGGGAWSPGTALRVEGDRKGHRVEFQSRDLGGTWESPRQEFIDIDTTPPAVVITTPQQGHVYVNDIDLGNLGLATTATMTLTVRADATDATSGVARVEFYVDEQLRRTDTSRPFNFAWDTSVEALGAHTIDVRAFDLAGNEAFASRSLLTIPASPEGVMASVP